ncbi:hypothetical protein L7F22_015974 [Adiantum nelumboides]|nr:hypothetical protein [Adiantum nelumboides]
MLISARYYMAYEHAVKLSWWNKSISCGPVVEQATHFLDLLSYFGGEVDRESISCQTVEWDENPGKLSKIGFNEEENIKEEDRIPRATSSIGKFENGGIGQLNHVVGLHGEFETMIFRGLGVEASNTYDTEFEIVADGWVFRLKSAYSKAPRLYTRRLGAQEEGELFEKRRSDSSLPFPSTSEKHENLGLRRK